MDGALPKDAKKMKLPRREGTLPIEKIITLKNARAWVSIDFK
jgi:hypothetical protein